MALGLLISFISAFLLVVIPKKKKSNIGYTLFKPIGIKHEYPFVDLEAKQVTATVSFQGKIHLTVLIDVKTDTVHLLHGSFKELKTEAMEEETYIDMFKNEAKFFIDNDINNPQKYYEQFK